MIHFLELLGIAIVLCSGVVIASLLKASAVAAPSPDADEGQITWIKAAARVAERRVS